MRSLESGMSVDNGLFSDMVRYEHETISGTTITNSNVGSPIFWGCNLHQLVFDTCDLTNARFFDGCTMDHCTFIRSDLRSVGMAKDEAVFTNCEFSSCDMRGMTLENATFIDCSFVKCRFNDRILQVAKIVNCSFTGKLVDITFEGNGRQKLIAKISARVKKALKEIEDDLILSDDDRKILSRSLRKLDSMEQYMFNTAYMKKIYGEFFVERFFSSLGVGEASS
ncbi:pentapeptide repeat-containing protein [Paenibacillus silvae]|nr:pentapeptide repeat-containing protein [Paenibacillus silvae]